LAALITAPKLVGADSGALSSSIASAPLSADQVVDHLVRKSQERAQALLHSEATRLYHLVYHGFPGDRGAEMTVVATYDSPSTKEFKVVSQSGSKLILDRVLKKLLESEDLSKTVEGQQLMQTIQLINENSFWRAQVAQLDIDNDGKVTIYPQVTGQRIEFGRLEDVEIKFEKLMIFYKEILPQRGWTKYHRVNLEYAGQVIAE